MTKLVFRRLWNNRWKAMSLMVGLVMAVAVAFCIPIYSNAVLQRILTKSIENTQAELGKFPGYYTLEMNMPTTAKNAIPVVETLDNFARDSAENYIELPVLSSGRTLTYDMFEVITNPEADIKERISLLTMLDLDSHINLVDGQMYSDEPAGDIIEAIATRDFLISTNMLYNQVYELKSGFSDEESMKIKIVGVFEIIDDDGSAFWYKTPNELKKGLFVSEPYMTELARDERFCRHLTGMQWYTAFDYHSIKPNDVDRLVKAFEDDRRRYIDYLQNDRLGFSMYDDMKEFQMVRETVNTNLMILVVPIFLMLAFYVVMVSQLKINGEKSEISTMQSRGAARRNILQMYLTESVFLTILSIGIGPWLGLMLCRMIGASNGFLEFINRKALPLRITQQSIATVIAVAVVFILIIMLPALNAARVGIVEQKQRKSRELRAPFWQRIGLDFILLAISGYGLYTLRQQRASATFLSGGATTGNTDFILYLGSTIFILGIGLLFLRLYPLLIQLVFKIGRRWWPASIYSAFHQINKSGQTVFIMLFIILTMSSGFFSADAARTINNHLEDNIRCETGADLVLRPKWKKYDQNGKEVLAEVDSSGMAVIGDEEDGYTTVYTYYREWSAENFTKLPSIENAVRVYDEDDVHIRFGSSSAQRLRMLNIDPYDFAQTSWNRYDLNTYHLNTFCNTLTNITNGVLLSYNLRDELSVEIGDTISIISIGGKYDVIVAGFIHRWPGFQPNYIDKDGNIQQNRLIVGNITYFFTVNAIRPYDFWLMRADGYTDTDVQREIQDAGTTILTMTSSQQQTNELKNSPVLQGTNGMFSIGFIISIIVSAVGFLIYWIVSIRGRTLQFGISRALGMTRRGIIVTLIFEQILVSGVALFAGLCIGRLSSMLFVPLYELTYGTADQAIRFRIFSKLSDYLQILGIMGVVLVICFVLLTIISAQLKIDQAIKLGEE